MKNQTGEKEMLLAFEQLNPYYCSIRADGNEVGKIESMGSGKWRVTWRWDVIGPTEDYRTLKVAKDRVTRRFETHLDVISEILI